MMYVIFGTYRETSQPIAYAEEEHTASRLVDLLAASDLTWEHIGYSEITTYRKTNSQWDYPFEVQYVIPEGLVIKPPWIDFIKTLSDELAKEQPHETSRTREGGVLPSSDDDEPIHYFGDTEERREQYEENLRSRMRRRSRINRPGNRT